MAKKYTDAEIKKLNENPNVVLVKYKSQIEYKDSFKKWAVMQSKMYPELSGMQIFELAGFDRNIITSRNASARIREWRKDKNNVKENQSPSDLDKQNNFILLTLLSRFDQLISILSKKKKSWRD